MKLKISIFPNGFWYSLGYTQEESRELVSWLYKNQGSQQRMHFGKRWFLKVYLQAGKHRKRKAEISFIQMVVEDYVANFDFHKKLTFKFRQGQFTYSDIIWFKI